MPNKSVSNCIMPGASGHTDIAIKEKAFTGAVDNAEQGAGNANHTSQVQAEATEVKGGNTFMAPPVQRDTTDQGRDCLYNDPAQKKIMKDPSFYPGGF